MRIFCTEMLEKLSLSTLDHVKLKPLRNKLFLFHVNLADSMCVCGPMEEKEARSRKPGGQMVKILEQSYSKKCFKVVGACVITLCGY